ncbi:hypothetical protein [Bradyrhizobium sp. Cp5.3]|uniref:hypothetical protein n=1 Tax=Bradyrhizobium sp. Cp5.3 TaxID=443598 RepID=UPI0004850DDD|nr:hypothetical protein [Bradyrhizobium sp. Cp5.3]
MSHHIYSNSRPAVAASSGNVANAVATATLPAAAGLVTHIGGFSVHGLGATSQTTVQVTVSGLVGVTLTYPLFIAASSATAPFTPIVISFDPPLPASTGNTAIVVSCPALGAGNTSVVANAFGYQA